MEREKLAERIEFLTGKDKQNFEAWQDSLNDEVNHYNGRR